MSDTKKCAHPACSCSAAKDSDYCSAYCEGQATTPDLKCSCGHMGCSGNTGRERP